MPAQECAKCGAVLTGRAKKFRLYLQAQGWTFTEVFGNLIWRCGKCGPAQKGDGQTGNR
jgi:ribosomal protein S27AE